LERCLGWAVVIGGIGGIFVSGSRSSYIGFLTSTAAFVAAWSVRKARISRISLAPAFVGLSGPLSFGTVLVLIVVWHRAHDFVLGGGAEASSTGARRIQWATALPLIKANPITGHGIATGGYDIAVSIDSYVISLILETGVPGFVFFAGIVCLPIWAGFEVTFSTRQNRARFRARWPAVSSRSSCTGLLCRSGRTTCRRISCLPWLLLRFTSIRRNVLPNRKAINRSADRIPQPAKENSGRRDCSAELAFAVDRRVASAFFEYRN
jgi:O-Antigen ligase